MADDTCAAEDCDRPRKRGRRYCAGHYSRYRKGSLGTTPIRVWTPPQQCSVADCEAPARTKGMCVKHFTRVKRHGDPTHVTPATGEFNNFWHGDEVGFGAAHDRVTSQRGRAADHVCINCGQPARHWAYDHLDPDEKRVDRFGPYSTKVEHYQPMCVPCHKRFDLDYLRTKHTAAVA